jgi:signal transduction histidine kinase
MATATTLRLRLTLGYLAVLAAVVGLVSLVCYASLLHAHATAVPLARSAPHAAWARLVAAAPAMGVPWLVAGDLGVLLLGALGAYVLAGRTLRPIVEAQARQERFAIAASHELRTPLTVLLGTLEAALLRRRTPEEYEDVLRRAQGAAEHLTILLNDILALAHAECGPETRAADPLDLRAIARAAAADIRAVADGKRQTVALALEGPLPTRGDPRALQQAVTSLLDNAVTYTPVGGTIRLVGRRRRGRALLVVHDTGPGIAPEHLPHLFEPLYRVDPARGNGGGHVGLGLARAAHIAQAHGGRLTIESQVGVGTVATLSLPLDEAGNDADSRPGTTPTVEASG